MYGKPEKRVALDGSVSFSLRIEIPRDPRTGRRRQKRITAPTEKELRRKVTAELKTIHDGGFVDKDLRTVGSFLQEWLRVSVGPRTRQTTEEVYRYLIELHILPRIGEVRLQELHQRHLQELYADLLKRGKIKGKGGGLGSTTVIHCHGIIRNALAQAVEWGLLSRNVADSVDPPRHQRAEIEVISEEEIRKLLQVAREHPWEPVWSIAVMTGMRRGEIMALRWSDVDFKKGEIRVSRSLTVTRDASLLESETKTRAGRRVITLAKEDIEVLRAAKRRQAALRLSCPVPWQAGDRIITTPDGRIVPPGSLSRTLKSLCRRAGIPEISFHALRHSHATFLLSKGVHPKVVQERLGHASISITMDTYSHLLPALQRQALEGISLFGDHGVTMDQDEVG